MIMMDITYVKQDIATTAAKLASLVGDYRVLTFEGDLGAGKTTLITALCRFWGVQGPVGSPTYALVNQYHANSLPEGDTIFHLDLYRLNNMEECMQAGLEEYFYSGACCLVEWPVRAWEMIPAKRLEVKLVSLGGDLRHIKVVSREN
jgi:tRNA threonylcarbamoyladenosine biosynthesis protein TsaE